MKLHQVRVGPMANFAYLLEGPSGEGILVDPAWDAPRLLAAAKEAGVRITHLLVTHGHDDHVNALDAIKQATGARVLAHASSDAPHDHGLVDGEHLDAAGIPLEIVHTPGHRFDAICTIADGTHLLTGDTLFVGDCGRVDLPGSDPTAMHDSLLTRLARLPEDLIVAPGHDYGPKPLSTLAEERLTNHTLKPRDLDAFLAFMAEP